MSEIREVMNLKVVYRCLKCGFEGIFKSDKCVRCGNEVS